MFVQSHTMWGLFVEQGVWFCPAASVTVLVQPVRAQLPAELGAVTFESRPLLPWALLHKLHDLTVGFCKRGRVEVLIAIVLDLHCLGEHCHRPQVH